MKRYGQDAYGDTCERADGKWVLFSDVEALVKAVKEASLQLADARNGNDSPMFQNVQAAIDSALKALGE